MLNVERILYAYFENLGKMERIQREIKKLMSVHGMQVGKKGGDVVGDPVARRMERIESLEWELQELEAVTVPVTRLIRDLPEELLYLLNQHYFKRKAWGEIWRRKGWHRQTGWRRKKELLRVAEEYLGPQ